MLIILELKQILELIIKTKKYTTQYNKKIYKKPLLILFIPTNEIFGIKSNRNNETKIIDEREKSIVIKLNNSEKEIYIAQPKRYKIVSNSLLKETPSK